MVYATITHSHCSWSTRSRSPELSWCTAPLSAPVTQVPVTVLMLVTYSAWSSQKAGAFSKTSGRSYLTVRLGALSLIATEHVFTLTEIFHSHGERPNCLQHTTPSINKKKDFYMARLRQCYFPSRYPTRRLWSLSGWKQLQQSLPEIYVWKRERFMRQGC